MMKAGQQLGGLFHNSLMTSIAYNKKLCSRRIILLSDQIHILKIEANGAGFFVLDFENLTSVCLIYKHV